MTLGDRLREERKRMGLNQPEFAALANTTKQTLFSWENGKTAPDGFQMAALAAAGADVLYVLTGSRSQPISEVETLSPRQRALLKNYDNTDDAGKRVIESTADFAAQPKRRSA